MYLAFRERNTRYLTVNMKADWDYKKNGNRKKGNKEVVAACVFASMEEMHCVLKVTVTYLVTPWSRVLLEKLTGLQLLKKFPVFYRTQRFFAALTKPATGPYPEPDQSSPWPPTHFLEVHRNIILLFAPGSSKWPLSLMFPHKKPCVNISFPPYELHAPPIKFI
jgi:hypothetical protein